MIVVSDTGPIHYLLLIDLEWLLERLFKEIWLPPAVLAELRHPNAPPTVRAWADALPAWAVEKVPSQNLPDIKAGPGETEAIALAKEFDGALLTDDDRAAKISRAEGIPVFGTLGVLQRGHGMALIEIEASLRALATTNYRHTPSLFERVIRQAHEMRRRS